MQLRRLVTSPLRALLRWSGYDVVPLGAHGAAHPEVPAAPEAAPPLDRNPILRRIYEEGLVEDADGSLISDARMSAV